ncbi:hypothetical protein J32TS6_11250 [Virgibacillus pantothenticus]|uniref:Uncharacterized protein n=1 Tax=Virgibacillus pantothenticus TaxID=1473 RepID=A0A0L0QM27_VIRPA|nr:hypothetical protein [Virgibacillus pantothenticus]KNE19559.1 hypothetical protein AFK71_13865 [Virgibacillus pantothenticus]MBU8565801.1 hypothetical protein [Virgibacillus pantothenticus]MBU8642100.1 hypothetical protein [Virgibacillus pantothenticus]MBU8645917.1 hypothetical protein [Virgibacillus pantothenticus]MBU8659463.1 hypothetical protein [Virgibacillus pantothenticus]
MPWIFYKVNLQFSGGFIPHVAQGYLKAAYEIRHLGAVTCHLYLLPEVEGTAPYLWKKVAVNCLKRSLL